MKLDISIRISLSVFVYCAYSAECIRLANSTLIFRSPSFGLPGLGLIIFSVLYVTIFV